MLNANLAREVEQLHEQIDYLRTLNDVLLKRIGIGRLDEDNKQHEPYEPVGGFQKMRDKIEQAEQNSLLEFRKKQEENNAG